ncbi:MAG: adenosylmethionine decarboxylase [Candidatus Krumholzibacteria bacterium]|nr:adenosylmethionine decarboxylase [Candidatus Krumholzibacteria bacterium]
MKPLGSQIIAEFVNCSRDILDDQQALEAILHRAIQESGLTLISTSGHKFDPVGVTVVAVIGESHVVIHTYPEARHASIDIFTCSNGSHAKNNLVRFLEKELKPSTIRLIDVNRGNPLEINEKDWITSFSSNGYETRYHIRQTLYSARSRYQQIDIIDNENFGRMLFLDRDLQIAENDAQLYNANLVAPLLRENHPLGRVAILGGGDGGVLAELLKYEPVSVVLVDIDEAVIEASKTYLSSVCGEAFEQPNVEVLIGDANEYLADARGLDAVIYDLTMYPEALTSADRHEFLGSIFSGIRRSLGAGGMVTMQCCSEFDAETRRLLSEILCDSYVDVDFMTSFIPAFCENWVFASARVKHTARTRRFAGSIERARTLR